MKAGAFQWEVDPPGNWFVPPGNNRSGGGGIRDRTVMMAAVLVLDPIFEADLQPEQYAYRRGRSALDAVQHVHKLINTGHGQIVDADLSSYFDSIPHAELMKSVARRVVDGAMLPNIHQLMFGDPDFSDERGVDIDDQLDLEETLRAYMS